MAKQGRPKKNIAEVKRFKRGKNWWLDWGSGSRRMRVSTGIEDERIAEDMRLEMQRFILDPDTNPLPTWALADPKIQKWVNTMDALEGVARKTNTKLHHESKLEELPIIQAYRQHLLAKHSKQTAASKFGNIMDMFDFIYLPPDEITSREADRYLTSITTENKRVRRSGRQGIRSLRTRNTIMKDCRLFFKWAIETQGFRANPFARFKELPVQETDDIIFCTKKERDKILKAVKGHPDELAYWLALYAGLRRNEIYQLKWDNLDIDKGFLHIIKMSVKNRKKRSIPLAKPLMKKLGDVNEKKGFIVKAWHGKQPYGDYADDRLDMLKEQLPDFPPEKIGYKVFRHTFCSLLLQAGVSESKIAMWAGHTLAVFRKHYGSLGYEHDADIEKAN